jgi:hypothetical protein
MDAFLTLASAPDCGDVLPELTVIQRKFPDDIPTWRLAGGDPLVYDAAIGTKQPPSSGTTVEW